MTNKFATVASCRMLAATKPGDIGRVSGRGLGGPVRLAATFVTQTIHPSSAMDASVSPVSIVVPCRAGDEQAKAHMTTVPRGSAEDALLAVSKACTDPNSVKLDPVPTVKNEAVLTEMAVAFEPDEAAPKPRPQLQPNSMVRDTNVKNDAIDSYWFEVETVTASGSKRTVRAYPTTEQAPVVWVDLLKGLAAVLPSGAVGNVAASASSPPHSTTRVAPTELVSATADSLPVSIFQPVQVVEKSPASVTIVAQPPASMFVPIDLNQTVHPRAQFSQIQQEIARLQKAVDSTLTQSDKTVMHAIYGKEDKLLNRRPLFPEYESSADMWDGLRASEYYMPVSLDTVVIPTNVVPAPVEHRSMEVWARCVPIEVQVVQPAPVAVGTIAAVTSTAPTVVTDGPLYFLQEFAPETVTCLLADSGIRESVANDLAHQLKLLESLKWDFSCYGTKPAMPKKVLELASRTSEQMYLEDGLGIRKDEAATIFEAPPITAVEKALSDLMAYLRKLEGSIKTAQPRTKSY